MDSNIEILDESAHRNIKIDFGQAREASRKETLVPVVISEFHTLMFHYPIVFVKDKGTGQFTASALMGINAEANLLDDKDLSHDEGLPLSIRRRPLIAVAPPPDTEGKRPLIGVNMSSSGVGRGERILNVKSASFESAISALGELYDGYEETSLYVKKIVDLELITKIKAEIHHKDKPKIALEGLYGIDNNKISSLKDRDSGSANAFLEISSYAYAQMFSLYNMNKLAPLVA